MRNNNMMIITDLDRSLLRNDKTISDYTIDIFHKCRERGIIISFATARPIRSTAKYLEIIQPEGVIFHNGAVVSAGANILKRHGITPHRTREIVTGVEKDFPGATISAEINDVMYTNFVTPDNSPFVKIDFNDLPDMDADKIIVGSISLEQIRTLEKYLTDELYLEINDGKYGFFMNKNASKWMGVIELSKYFGIDPGDTIAFGDDINDLTMIKNCGKGICMRNGLEEVKAVADEICEDNENDGIAKWIQKNIL